MRRLSLLVALLYVVGMVGLWLWLRPGLPALDQTITGVRLNGYDDPRGVAYLSGERLECDGTVPDRCTVELLGETLEIVGKRNPPGHPNQLGGTCEAIYRGETWSCEMTSRHIHVHHFATIEQPLGFSAEQLADVRRQYAVENLAELTVVRGGVALALLGGVLAALVAATLPGVHRVARGALAGLALPIVAVVSLIILMRMTSGLWD